MVHALLHPLRAHRRPPRRRSLGLMYSYPKRPFLASRSRLPRHGHVIVIVSLGGPLWMYPSYYTLLLPICRTMTHLAFPVKLHVSGSASVSSPAGGLKRAVNSQQPDKIRSRTTSPSQSSHAVMIPAYKLQVQHLKDRCAVLVQMLMLPFCLHAASQTAEAGGARRVS